MHPCVGCGSLLLPASNHSLRLFALDLNPLMVKLALVNLWLYAPWGATGSYHVDFGPENPYPNFVGRNVRQGNSLVEILYGHNIGWDEMIANPPFGGKTDLQRLERGIDEYLGRCGTSRQALTRAVGCDRQDPLAGARVKTEIVEVKGTSQLVFRFDAPPLAAVDPEMASPARPSPRRHRQSGAGPEQLSLLAMLQGSD